HALAAVRPLQPVGHARPPVPLGHPGRRLPLRIRAGHRGLVAVGAPERSCSMTERDTVSATEAGPLRREAVPAAFDVGASAYDRLVGANPGYHDHLEFSARGARVPGAGPGGGVAAAR